MRRATLLALALCLVAAAPASAAGSSSTRTPVRVIEPTPANATVAGFELDLVKTHAKKKSHKATAAAAFAHIAAGLPKNVSVFAVVGKQKRSDRVKGVLVTVNRASTVTTAASAGPSARARRLTINLKHAAIPKGFKLALKLAQSSNVLGSHRAFACGSYFKTSDLAGVQRLGGPALKDITMGTLVQAACAAAKKNPPPFPTLGEFRTALNAPSGALAFTVSSLVPNVVNGAATFNYGVRAFSVLADKGHQFAACAFTLGTCAVSTSANPNDYAVFTLTTPAPAGTQLPFSLAMVPNPSAALPFQFFGFDSGNHRQGPLLTTGP